MKTLFDIDQFAYPWVLPLLLVVPIFWIWYVQYYNKKRLVIRLSYDPTQFKKPNRNLTLLRYLPLILQSLALGMLIVAAARPQSATSIVERYTEGVDIMILLDVSGSMEATDFPPDRLSVAKQNAINFINGRDGDRIGIVLFAEDAFSYVPLTLDYDWLKKMIADIRFNIVPKQGTAIGSAMSVGINRLRGSKSPSKVMILFTDGASNRGDIDPKTAARLAKLYRIKTHCISIGKPEYTRKTVEGDKVVADLDEGTLKKVAEMTGGKSYRAEDAESLSSIFKEISDMEKSKVSEDVYRDIKDLYPLFLKIAILSLLLSFVSMLTFIYNPLEQ